MKTRMTYAELGHAIQTGVMYDQEHGSPDGSPKHLRTGLNLVMSDLGSLARLLIKKGVITEQEYFEALLEGLEEELDRYEKLVQEKLGRKVTLR